MNVNNNENDDKQVLVNIEPQKVFHYFEEISKIPRGSGNTKLISDYCQDFAAKHNFKYVRDEYNNIIIFKPGTAGYEDSKPVMIQGHLDMVCEKEENSEIDFAKDGLSLAVKDGLVYAEGTTLGADDGIAVAYALAILDSEDIDHPALEVIFTVDEEIGMLGASALDTSSLSSNIMLNLDTEDEGYFLVSCAGGVTASCILPVKRVKAKGYEAVLKIEGLTGGHSGIEIDKCRANANQLMGRLLYSLCYDYEFYIDYVRGGNKDNAIARSCEARLIFSEKTDLIELDKTVKDLLMTYQWEFESTDPDLDIVLECTLSPMMADVLSEDSTKKVITTLYSHPGGVQKMSRDIDGLVQTSLNMGILDTDESEVKMSFSVRSSVSAEKVELLTRIECLMKYMGGKVILDGDYPAWEFRKDSPLRDLMVEVFEEQYGTEPVVYAVHAGVECGIFADKIDNLDCVSFGPELKNIHTTRETMNIASVQRTWNLLLETLKRLK